jgi:nitrogenase molybdenum-iron protein beta chain
MIFTEKSRNSCALHGALGTINAINGVVPVVHATAGCGVRYAEAYGKGGGALPAGALWGNPLSSTNIEEKHVVFGGGSRLREQLKNTVKILDARVYAIVTGCATEIVGDDVAAMAKEGLDQGFPVVFANTPGFRGTFHHGYERLVRALIEQLPESVKQLAQPGSAQPPVVNIWGILPQQDPFWKTHLVQIARIVKDLGAIPNPLFDSDQSLEAFAQVPNAALNVAASYWGVGISTWLNTAYRTPFAALPQLPIGPSAARRAAEIIAAGLSFDTTALLSAAAQKEEAFRNILSALRPAYFAEGWQRDVSIVAEAATALGIADFVEEYLGMEPSTIIITDPLPDPAKENVRQIILERFKIDGPAVMFTEDGDVIANALENKPSGLIFGSTLEWEAARSINAPLVRVAFPADDTLIIDRGFIGKEGATYLLEEIGTAIRRNR